MPEPGPPQPRAHPMVGAVARPVLGAGGHEVEADLVDHQERQQEQEAVQRLARQRPVIITIRWQKIGFLFHERTSPVTAFPPNGYGLHDMIGNVWEWTSDWYAPKHEADAPKACCIPENPRGGGKEGSYDPRQPNIKIARKVIKGGSHLCAPNYCRRYRPAARHAEAVDTSTSHLGFRCVKRTPTAE